MILEEMEGMAKNVVKLTGGKRKRIMIIVCDTDFLSSLLKGDRPVAVLSEVTKTELITDLMNN